MFAAAGPAVELSLDQAKGKHKTQSPHKLMVMLKVSPSSCTEFVITR